MTAAGDRLDLYTTLAVLDFGLADEQVRTLVREGLELESDCPDRAARRATALTGSAVESECEAGKCPASHP